jgi:DNA-directed RNA polymerase subunit RPC12/RpoP
MGRDISSLQFDVDAVRVSSTCGTCREAFEEPLLAMVFSDSLVEEYYACPKCLSRVAKIDPQKAEKANEVDMEEAVEVKELGAIENSADRMAGCLYHLGYLKRRGKNVPIPEECLTCSKIIECMY